MTDKEILNEVYQTCKREPDVGSGEITNIIEREWQRRDDSHGYFSDSWYGSDLCTNDTKEIERHRGLEIGEDGTVTNLK
tara:strand:+ start:355 stop:591 length:237 start_codon:yes stop_codon:yes gene_type:complete